MKNKLKPVSLGHLAAKDKKNKYKSSKKKSNGYRRNQQVASKSDESAEITYPQLSGKEKQLLSDLIHNRPSSSGSESARKEAVTKSELGQKNSPQERGQTLSSLASKYRHNQKNDLGVSCDRSSDEHQENKAQNEQSNYNNLNSNVKSSRKMAGVAPKVTLEFIGKSKEGQK